MKSLSATPSRRSPRLPRQVRAAATGRSLLAAAVTALAAWLTVPAALPAGGVRGIQGAGTAGATGADNAAGKPAPLDPVVQEVVRLLGSKVSEPVIERWLAEGHHPAVVGSRELIVLKQAGASDQLTEKLLDLATRRTATASGNPPQAAAGRDADTAVPSPGRHAAKLLWTVTFHPNFLADDERWDLFVYLDGRYLAWVKAPVVSFLQKPLEFEASVAPGHHLVRLMEERHVRKPNTNDWDNQARVAPKALPLDLKPDTPGKVEVVLEVRPRGGPVTLQISQGDSVEAKEQPSLPLPENWQPLCEEVPAQKEPCLHWSDLWPDVPTVPSREAVREQLERAHFRPLPAQPGTPGAPAESREPDSTGVHHR
jgi:hypothetical protein